MRVFDIWAEWCPPCKRFAPIFESVAQKFPDVQFIKVDADSQIGFEILNEFRISSIPTILVVNDENQVIFQHAGILSEPNLELLVSQAVAYSA